MTVFTVIGVLAVAITVGGITWAEITMRREQAENDRRQADRDAKLKREAEAMQRDIDDYLRDHNGLA